MPEPAQFAIEKAVSLTIAYLGEAKKHAADDARACKEYVNAALEAVKGLEAEYDEILNQARVLDPGKDADRVSLERRIGSYLDKDLLRPELIKAIAGLNGCRQALEKRAAGVLQWPWKRSDREKAIQDFATSLEILEGFLTRLQNEDLPYRRARTGVGHAWLLHIEDVLRSQLQDPREKRRRLDDVLKEADADRTKDRMVSKVREIVTTAEKLVREFR